MKVTVIKDNGSGSEVFTVGTDKGLEATRPERVATEIALNWFPYTNRFEAKAAVKAAVKMLRIHHADSVNIHGVTIHKGDSMNTATA